MGVAYILFLAWEGWQPDRENSPSYAGAASGSLFWRGFFSNVFNPKSIIFFVSVVPGFVRYESDDRSLSVQIALFGIIYVALATIVHASIVMLASQLRPLADDRIPAECGQTSPLPCAGAGRCMAGMDNAPSVRRSRSITSCSQAHYAGGNASANCLF